MMKNALWKRLSNLLKPEPQPQPQPCESFARLNPDWQMPDLLTIEYHPRFEIHFHDFAKECGWDPDRLRQHIHDTIRTCVREAIISDPSRKAHDGVPDIYDLVMGNLMLHFSFEPPMFVIRGLTWETLGEPLYFYDGGFFVI